MPEIYLSEEAPWRGPGGAPSLGNLEIVGGPQKGSISLCRSSVRWGSFLGILKDVGRRAQRMDIIPSVMGSPFTKNF